MKRGLRKGDKVSFMLSNGYQTTKIFLGAMYGGFVIAPLNLQAQPSQLEYVVDHSDTKLILFTEDQRSRVDGGGREGEAAHRADADRQRQRTNLPRRRGPFGIHPARGRGGGRCPAALHLGDHGAPQGGDPLPQEHGGRRPIHGPGPPTDGPGPCAVFPSPLPHQRRSGNSRLSARKRGERGDAAPLQHHQLLGAYLPVPLHLVQRGAYHHFLPHQRDRHPWKGLSSGTGSLRPIRFLRPASFPSQGL